MEIQRSIITLGIWTVSFLLTMLVLGTFGLRSFRETVLMSATAHGVWVWMSCEVLGAVGLLAPIGLMVSWMAWLLALAAIARSRRGYLRGSTRYWFSQLRGAFREWRLPTVLFPLSFSAAVVSILLVLALAAAPNNVDSMTYHLSRVMHWQQERSLDPYPTHILRQLWTGPWAELAVASLQVAVGNDRLANMPQWLAMLGSMIGVSRLASLLGASGRGQAFAVLVAVTIPMGIVQSTSTQNDYVVALWLVVFCVFFIGVAVGRRSQPPGRLSVLTCGAALGLAVLTKATAALFALPIAIWLGFSLLQHGRRAVWSGLTIFAIALGLNAPHFLRNVNIFGAAGGPSMAGYLNGAYGVPELVSNVVRNPSPSHALRCRQHGHRGGHLPNPCPLLH
jgi:Dolichyl-phosphate-mannose-protein mannosyltransferase